MKIQWLSKIILIHFYTLIPLFLHSCKEEPNTAPVATFTISPAFGSTETNFTFDASGVKDLEDPVADLQVRWDWESDTIFDTEFSTSKIINHKFVSGGTLYVTVEVKDTKGTTSRFKDYVKVEWYNRPPQAALTITPRNGFLQDVFKMDASASSDQEDKTALMARFDFEGDGTWDTEYSTTKIVYHQYTAANTYTAKVMVKDSGDSTAVAGVILKVAPTNQAPEAPKDPHPAHQAAGATTLGALSWTCIDPEMDSLKYDVYFGKDANPPKVASDKAGARYTCPPLEYATRYYWKVVAKDPYSHEAAGPIWSFTTGTPMFPLGTFSDARDGKAYKTVTINGRIWMAQNLNYGDPINSSSGGDAGDGFQTDNNKVEKFCFNNDPANCELYGGLYQWNEAMAYGSFEGTTGICPENWHLPSATEWIDLVAFLDPVNGESQAGDLLVLGSLSGFQALFSGYLIWAQKGYVDDEQAGYFWSSTAQNQTSLLVFIRSYFRGKPAFQQDFSQKFNGLSVRCVKND